MRDRGVLRAVATVCLATVVGAACSLAGPASSSSSGPPLPQGFTRYTDHRFGFEIGLAPGWKVAPYQFEGSVSWDGPGDVSMVVHFEAAASTELHTAAAPLFWKLKAGEGLPSVVLSASRLAGRPAERATGQVTTGSRPQAIVAYVMIEGNRAWEVATGGPPQAVTAATAIFEEMVATFRLVGTRSTP